MGTKDPRIDAYIENAQPFARPILTRLRKAIHAGCPEVEEDLKWSNPSFMYKGILCGMAAFQRHVTFGFWKATTLNAAVSGRSGGTAGPFERISSVDDLPDQKTLVALVKKAAALHDEGIKAEWMQNRKPRKAIPEPDYFLAALKKHKKALKTYEAFSPSHKREYLEWITEAKREDTRQKRLAAAIEWMAEGKPHNWRYM